MSSGADLLNGLASAAVLVALLASVAVSQVVLAGAIMKVTACDGVNLRTLPKTTATRKATLRAGIRLTVTATVTGSRYTVTCAGRTTSGTGWYRISAINDRSVSSLYHVMSNRGVCRTTDARPLCHYVDDPSAVGFGSGGVSGRGQGRGCSAE